MKYLNKKQILQLAPYENHFHTVIYAKYKRATTARVNDLIADIYEDVTGEVISRKWSCSQCVFNIFEKCGRLYYESVKILNEKNGAKKQTTNKRSKERTGKSTVEK